MKRFVAILLIIPLLGLAKPVESVTIRNPVDKSLNEFCVVVDRAKLKPSDDLLPVIKDQRSGKLLPSQVDDMDGDGNWDEFAFLVSLAGKEKLSFDIAWVAKKDYPQFPVRTNVYLGISRERNSQFTEVTEEIFPPDYTCDTPYQYQFEGVGWENEKIAFRTYCDMRNGKDIFGKTGKDMILPDVGKVDNYHDEGDWGMDVLKVGSSLGIGAIAVIDNGKLIRLSDTDYHDFRVVAEGPVRSIFELGFTGWNVNGKQLSAKETITITAGRDGFKNKVEINGKPEAVVAGLSMLGNDGNPETLDFAHAHGITLSGINDVDNSFLGMSILVAKNKKFESDISPATKDVYDTSSEEYKNAKYHAVITDTYYLSTPGSKAEFIVHSMWGTRYPCISTCKDYQAMAEEDALHYFTKLRVKVK